jgi:hypothetical protein
MKLAIGQKLHDGPWGGGNNFVRSLQNGAIAAGHTVTSALEPDTDIALLIDPRARNPLVTFTPGDIVRHIAKHPDTLVVQRINECDERKGTKFMNARLRLCNALADHTVFIASWLRELNVWCRRTPSSVILNGGDTAIFNSKAYSSWTPDVPMRLLTHHWGGNAHKGFDVYQKIDDLIAQPKWRDRLCMTYVGNLPAGIRFQNITHLPPLSGHPLADEIRKGHVYITASINEPAGMHHVEGALCGLPLLFRASGALPEYCTGYGEMFAGVDDFESSLERMIANYARHRAALSAYPNTADAMIEKYLALFADMVADRQAYIARRREIHSSLAMVLNRIPF